MKNKLLLALVGMAAMFTGCNKENVDDFATGKQATSFNVSVDGGVKTRGEVTPPEEAPSRYVMEIYKGATAAGGTFVSHKEQATGTFTDVVLDNAQEYTVLFWADYGTPSTDGTHQANNEYNASDLKAAVIAKQPTKAAFAGMSRFTVGGAIEESVYTKVTLDHAVAQVNFKQTEALTAANNTLVVSFDKSCSLNVDGNVATEISGAVEYTFTRNGDKTAGTLGTSYIIAATGEPKTMLEITATLNGETPKAISNVPFERNFRTNISGAYSDKYNATLKATCEDEWETPDYNEEIPTPADDNFIEVNKIKVAIGNLIANGANGAKIGAATDGGLYFQFGSLIGWSDTGDATIAVKPANFDGNEGWADTGKIWQGKSSNVPFTVAGSASTDEKAGIGDPCRYYLGGTWRLPTKTELEALFNNPGWPSTGPWSRDATSKAASHTSGLIFPASGSRLSTSGKVLNKNSRDYYWSATAAAGSSSFSLYFLSAGLYPSSGDSKEGGYTVRCVCN